MGMGGRFTQTIVVCQPKPRVVAFFSHRNAAMKGLSSNPETKIVKMFSGSAQKRTTTLKGFCIKSRLSSQIRKG